MTFTVTSRMSFCFLKTYFHEKPVGLKQKTNSSKINTAKTGLFIFVHFKCTHCLNFVSLHLTFLFIAYLFTLLNFTYGILTLIFCFIYERVSAYILMQFITVILHVLAYCSVFDLST